MTRDGRLLRVTASLPLRPLALVAAIAVTGAFFVPAADAGPPSAKKALEKYLKAKKDKDREKAWAVVLATSPLSANDIPKLRALAVGLVRKRGRKIGSGREEWFDEEEDGWKGLYLTSGKGKKGLALGLHGGGAGSGDAGQASSAFAGPI